MILIIGAGIGGLATGIALRRAGREVAIFERVSQLGEVGAGLSLWQNALHALDRLGVGIVREHSVAAEESALRTWDGRTLVALKRSDLVDRFGELGVVIHRAALQRVLLDALGPGVVTTGRMCTHVTQDDDGVTAFFADGSDARGDVLVGADGLHSVIRAQLHGEQPPRYAGYTAWRGVVRFDPAAIVPGESWGAGRRFGQMPMGDGQVYWFATTNAPEGARATAGEKREVQRLFGGWHRPIEALIDATDEADILRNDIYDRPPLALWGRGRVTLVGDAAHPMTPNLGQGACQALEDAVVLGRCLEHAADPAVGLRTYQSQRRQRANRILLASRRIGAVAQWQSPLAVWLRNVLMRHVAARFQKRQLGDVIGYRV